MGSPWRNNPTKAYKPRDSAVTSKMMSAVKDRDSKAELSLRRALHARGLRFRLHRSGLVGKPDIVFIRSRVVVFVDGDFWHGRALIDEGIEGLRRGLRTEKVGWWIEKIKRTVERDQFVTKSLQDQGWEVVRIWESELLEDAAKAATFIEQKVRDKA